ncbi:MAG: hypothetical protein VX777_04635 [Chlamydiota bacterium]|nr:hypothetical protein [Chlamydiota bacterium]
MSCLKIIFRKILGIVLVILSLGNALFFKPVIIHLNQVAAQLIERIKCAVSTKQISNPTDQENLIHFGANIFYINGIEIDISFRTIVEKNYPVITLKNIQNMKSEWIKKFSPIPKKTVSSQTGVKIVPPSTCTTSQLDL